MTAPSINLTEQMLRRRPVIGAPVAHGASANLNRTIGTFQLTMFGVGATVGTGIFFVLSEAVPRRAERHHLVPDRRIGGRIGGAVLRRTRLGGAGVGLDVLLRLLDPRRGGRDGVAACLLLEYGGGHRGAGGGLSQYVNKLLDNFLGHKLPQALSAAPWDATPGWINLPAVVVVMLCAVLLIRGASESATVNTVMVIIKLSVLGMFAVISFTAFDADRFADFAPFGAAGVGAAAGTIFFSYRHGRGLHRRRRGQEPAEDHARALVATCWWSPRSTSWCRWPPSRAELAKFDGREAGLAVILDKVTGANYWGTVLAAGAVISIFSVTLVTMYGQTRILFAMGRDGLLPPLFARVNPRSMTPVNNTVVVAVIVGLLAGFVPLDYLADLVSIGTLVAFCVVSLGVIILRRREPDLPRGFRVPGYPVTPALAIPGLRRILASLHWYTWVAFAGWLAAVLVFYFTWGRHHSALQPQRSQQQCSQPWGSQPRGPHQRCSQQRSPQQRGEQ